MKIKWLRKRERQGDPMKNLQVDEKYDENELATRAMGEYQLSKDHYLMLCRRYGLNPFDLDILDHNVSKLPHRDRVELVRLILRLVRIERSFRGAIGVRLLFPLTIEQSERTGYLVPLPVASGAR